MLPSLFLPAKTVRAEPMHILLPSLYRMKLLSDRFNAMAGKLEDKKKMLGAEDDADGQGGSEIVS